MFQYFCVKGFQLKPQSNLLLLPKFKQELRTKVEDDADWKGQFEDDPVSSNGEKNAIGSE